jgi:short subunit dehydrogenase-like uncharacterized protein
MNWLIYGANGYTGELIAREAKARNLSPILAGRDEKKVASLARELGLEHRVFALDASDAIARHLLGVGLVLHCAGPFSATSGPVLDACLAVRAHYLDITGEIAVFEQAHGRHEQAEKAGVVVCPGVGFDVIPTDCLAATLKKALPGATHLALGFDAPTRMSPGTAKTTVEGIAQGGRVRQEGRIIEVPLAHRVRRIDFGDGEKWAMTIPWGDVATAYHTTGIPNIEVFVPASPRLIASTQRANHVRWFLGWRPIQSLLKRRAGKMKGPSAERREKMPTYVWGEVLDEQGGRKTARIKTANGYSVTVSGSLAVVEHLLKSSDVHGGSYTPAKLLGADLVTRLPGSGPFIVE